MSDPKAYLVSWICAISTELVAARQFLDDEHEPPEHISQHDKNTYTLGRMGKHNVVVAALPDGEYGIGPAASVARDMLSSFPNVRIGLMVGIGGGAPSEIHDIRLGDVVISSPKGGSGGIYQYDFGKTIQDRKFVQTGILNQPRTILRTAVTTIEAIHESDGNQMLEAVNAILDRKPRLRSKYRRPNEETDCLYKTEFIHQSEDGACKPLCGRDAVNLVQRAPRTEECDSTVVHYGVIASANQLMKDARVRNALGEEKGVLCFEMEAAGLMNHFPCLVIRGICDYADSHKNRTWQGYAAMAAAAYAKGLLAKIAPTQVEYADKVAEHLSSLKDTVMDLKLNNTNRLLENWLSPPDCSNNYKIALGKRHDGTGQWFLKSEIFMSFKRSRTPFLWLNGIPGCGKTILSSSIIEDLRQEPSGASDVILYFYFDFNDKGKQTLETAVRSLLWQTGGYSGNSLAELEQLYGSCKEGRDQPSVQALIDTLSKTLHGMKRAKIILDALDECTTRGHLLSWLTQLARQETGNVQIIATSRREQCCHYMTRCNIEFTLHLHLVCDNDIYIVIVLHVAMSHDVAALLPPYASHEVSLKPMMVWSTCKAVWASVSYLRVNLQKGRPRGLAKFENFRRSGG